MPMLKANVECWRDRLHIPYGCPWSPYGGSEAASGCAWDRIWLLEASIWLLMGSPWQLRDCFWMPLGSMWLFRGSIWLPIWLHIAAQRLHLAAEGLHFALYGPSVAPMRQICSVCCIWLGQAEQPGSRAHAKLRVARAVWGP